MPIAQLDIILIDNMTAVYVIKERILIHEINIKISNYHLLIRNTPIKTNGSIKDAEACSVQKHCDKRVQIRRHHRTPNNSTVADRNLILFLAGLFKNRG